jgi:hypothetical protein
MCLRPSANEGGILAPSSRPFRAAARLLKTPASASLLSAGTSSTGQPLSRATTGWIPLPAVPIAVFYTNIALRLPIVRDRARYEGAIQDELYLW